MNHLVSRQTFFLFVAVVLMLIATNRFRSDLPAFFWSLIVLGGAVWFERGDGGAR